MNRKQRALNDIAIGREMHQEYQTEIIGFHLKSVMGINIHGLGSLVWVYLYNGLFILSELITYLSK